MVTGSRSAIMQTDQLVDCSYRDRLVGNNGSGHKLFSLSINQLKASCNKYDWLCVSGARGILKFNGARTRSTI